MRHLIAVAVSVFILLVVAPVVHSHEWYVGKKDPKTMSSCCGGHDCSAIPSQWITEVPGGIRIVMSLEQAQQVNPATIFPVDAFVSEERIQQSPDLDWHACVYQNNRTAPGFGIICLWGFRGA